MQDPVFKPARMGYGSIIRHAWTLVRHQYWKLTGNLILISIPIGFAMILIEEVILRGGLFVPLAEGVGAFLSSLFVIGIFRALSERAADRDYHLSAAFWAFGQGPALLLSAAIGVISLILNSLLMPHVTPQNPAAMHALFASPGYWAYLLIGLMLGIALSYVQALLAAYGCTLGEAGGALRTLLGKGWGWIFFPIMLWLIIFAVSLGFGLIFAAAAVGLHALSGHLQPTGTLKVLAAAILVLWFFFAGIFALLWYLSSMLLAAANLLQDRESGAHQFLP